MYKSHVPRTRTIVSAVVEARSVYTVHDKTNFCVFQLILASDTYCFRLSSEFLTTNTWFQCNFYYGNITFYHIDKVIFMKLTLKPYSKVEKS